MVFPITIHPLLLLVGIFSICFFILWSVKRLIFLKLEAKKPMVHALSLPVTLVLLAVSLGFSGRTAGIPADLKILINIIVTLILVLALILFLDRLIWKTVSRYSGRMPKLIQMEGILKGAVRGVLLAFGILILLESYGISITPFLASLGIGSLAVALALQDTLSNFFAGVQILADRQIRLGDFIRMETGQEGVVERLGWRSTQIRLLSNTMLVVPNNKLTGSIIVNYDMPQREISVAVEGSVHYDSDLKKVEKIISAVAKEVLNSVPGGIKNYEPAVRFHTFGDFGIKFNVGLRAQSFVDQFLLKHEFIKRLHERFRQESIAIPYPLITPPPE